MKHVKEELLPFFYVELSKLGFTDLGYNTIQDITACPRTDTCNLGISSSTGIAKKLEDILKNEYPQFTNNKDITIKISGCMNACGQHNMTEIGFQGMYRTKDKMVATCITSAFRWREFRKLSWTFSDKVIKTPSKRGDDALRYLLDDFSKKAQKT